MGSGSEMPGSWQLDAGSGQVGRRVEVSEAQPLEAHRHHRHGGLQRVDGMFACADSLLAGEPETIGPPGCHQGLRAIIVNREGPDIAVRQRFDQVVRDLEHIHRKGEQPWRPASRRQRVESTERPDAGNAVMERAKAMRQVVLGIAIGADQHRVHVRGHALRENGDQGFTVAHQPRLVTSTEPRAEAAGQDAQRQGFVRRYEMRAHRTHWRNMWARAPCGAASSRSLVRRRSRHRCVPLICRA
jgi:hypothetical protein